MNAPQVSGEPVEALPLRVEVQDALATVVIARSHKRNAMTQAMWRDMAALFRRFDGDGTLRGVILRGAGAVFSAGADIGEFRQARAGADAALAYDADVDACCRAIEECAKPVIAVVEGPAVGGGAALAMACDFRFAGPAASFAVPAARLSIALSEYNTNKLIALCGLAQARRILLTAQPVGAERALQIGLVDGLSDAPLDDALALADTIGRNAPLSIRAAKLACASLASVHGDDASRERVREAIRRAADSLDAGKARQAFLERREPVFSGD